MVVPEVLICLDCCVNCIGDELSCVSWICGVMVTLSASLCNACLSLPVNINLICFHPIFVWSVVPV